MHDIARGLRALWAPVVFIGGMILVLRLPGMNATDAIVMALTELGIGIQSGRSLARKLHDPQVAEDAFNASIVMAPGVFLIYYPLEAMPWYQTLLRIHGPIRLLDLVLPLGILITSPWIYARVRWGIRDCRPPARDRSQAKD